MQSRTKRYLVFAFVAILLTILFTIEPPQIAQSIPLTFRQQITDSPNIAQIKLQRTMDSLEKNADKLQSKIDSGANIIRTVKQQVTLIKQQDATIDNLIDTLTEKHKELATPKKKQSFFHRIFHR